MDDYDWTEAPPPADPDLHSWHSDTRLDHCCTIEAGMAFAFMDSGRNRVSLLGGFGSAPYVALTGKVSYAVTGAANIFASVAYDKFFAMKGEGSVTDTNTGETFRAGYNSGGADLYTLNLALVVDVEFYSIIPPGRHHLAEKDDANTRS